MRATLPWQVIITAIASVKFVAINFLRVREKGDEIFSIKAKSNCSLKSSAALSPICSLSCAGSASQRRRQLYQLHKGGPGNSHFF